MPLGSASISPSPELHEHRQSAVGIVLAVGVATVLFDVRLPSDPVLAFGVFGPTGNLPDAVARLFRWQ